MMTTHVDGASPSNRRVEQQDGSSEISEFQNPYLSAHNSQANQHDINHDQTMINKPRSAPFCLGNHSPVLPETVTTHGSRRGTRRIFDMKASQNCLSIPFFLVTSKRGQALFSTTSTYDNNVRTPCSLLVSSMIGMQESVQ